MEFVGLKFRFCGVSAISFSFIHIHSFPVPVKDTIRIQTKVFIFYVIKSKM